MYGIKTMSRNIVTNYNFKVHISGEILLKPAVRDLLLC